MGNGTFYYLSDMCDFQQVFEMSIYGVHCASSDIQYSNVYHYNYDRCGFWWGGGVCFYVLQ